MSTSKEKHPSWFKMKLERRTTVKQLKPRVAVNVLLACWEFLETGERPTGLSPIESIAFSAFIPDLEDAWATYIKRISSGTNGGRPPKDEKPYGSVCPHSIPCDTVQNHAVPHGTEEEPEPEVIISPLTPPRGKRERFTPPTVEDVAAYCLERKNGIDPEEFVSFYASKGWKVGSSPMKNWRAALITWEKKRAKEISPEPKSAKRGRLVVGEDGEEACVFDA
ncbi:hypothetical protein [Oscillibacter sp. CU971]|uniref:hypothetical protein n=1 Tax=Oscillibacter sp. CU971 TaxID=2780102 RepID=UPI00195858E6|nr:hypothetical protein [Oscillibacter sp. CU971]